MDAYNWIVLIIVVAVLVLFVIPMMFRVAKALLKIVLPFAIIYMIALYVFDIDLLEVISKALN